MPTNTLAAQVPVLATFCRETRSPRVKPLPDGRGSDQKSRVVNEAIRATTVREWLLLRHTAFSRQKLADRPKSIPGANSPPAQPSGTRRPIIRRSRERYLEAHPETAPQSS